MTALEYARSFTRVVLTARFIILTTFKLRRHIDSQSSSIIFYHTGELIFFSPTRLYHIHCPRAQPFQLLIMVAYEQSNHALRKPGLSRPIGKLPSQP